jgi:hypothetical protein
MKVLLNNREDFDRWYKCNDSCEFISYEEDEPKNYPCIVSFRVVDSYDSIYDDLYYEFIYLQDFSELDEDIEDLYDDPEYVAINKEDISVGDYIGIECERFACDSCHLRIVDIQQRYDAITGEPYKIVTDEEDEIWSTQSGNCLSNPTTFYEIYGYFRELK